MIYNIDQIEPQLINAVKKDFDKSTSVSDIALKYSLTHSEILCMLSEIGVSPSRLKLELCEFDFGKEPFIVISDTHFGSELENTHYINKVYEFAKENGIKIILHTGDFYQSTIRPVSKKYRDINKQVEHGIEVYPYDSDIFNYILFGNHDFHLMKQNDSYYQVVSSRKDFNVLGFKKAYFTWCKRLMLVHHEIDKYHMNLPHVEPFFRFCGHRHEMKVIGDHTMRTPTLSDDVKYYNQYNHPGFLVVKKEYGKMKIYHYFIKDFTDTNVKTIGTSIPIFPHGVVLTKKLYCDKIES